MRPKYSLLCGLLMSVAVSPALAQPAPAPSPVTPAERTQTTTSTSPIATTPGWRASKLVGVNVYNNDNEKIGDISEICSTPRVRFQASLLGSADSWPRPARCSWCQWISSNS